MLPRWGVGRTADATDRNWSGASGGGGNNSWTNGANWTGGTAPANNLTDDIAVFDLSSYPRQPTANSVSINGIRIGNGSTATAPLTISGSGTGLAIGSSGISMLANAGATTLSAATTIGAAQSWSNASSNSFTVQTGGLTYTFALTLTGGGAFTFAAAGTGGGGVIIDGATITNDSSGAIFGSGALEFRNGTYKSSNSSTRSLLNVVNMTGDFTFDAVSTGINEFKGGGSTTGDRALTVNKVTTRFVDNPLTLGGNLSLTGTGRLNVLGGLKLGGANRTITGGLSGSLGVGVNGNTLISGAIDSSASGNTLTLSSSSVSGSIVSVNGALAGATNVVNFAVDTPALNPVNFSGTNTFAGSVTVKAGILAATSDAALGSTTATTAGLALAPAAAGTARVNFTSAAPAIASLSSSGAGAGSTVTVSLGTGGSETVLTVGGNNASTTFGGSIIENPGGGQLVKVGSGTLTLEGASTYTGTTTVSEGTLRANNTTGSATGTGSVSLAGGRLDGEGTIGNTVGAIVVDAGGTIGAGNGASDVGMLTTNKQVWAPGGTYEATVDGSGVTATADLLKIANTSGADLTITADSTTKFTIKVVTVGGPLQQSDGWITIASSLDGSVTGFSASKFTLVDENNLPAPEYEIGATGPGVSGSSGGFDIQIRATPEPTTTAYFATAAGLLALRRWRRRAG